MEAKFRLRLHNGNYLEIHNEETADGETYIFAGIETFDGYYIQDIACIREGSNKDQQTIEVLLWEDEETVDYTSKSEIVVNDHE